MAADSQVTTLESNSPESIPEIKTRELLESPESYDDLEDAEVAWQDFLSLHADMGVRP